MIMDVFSIPEKQKSSTIALKIMRWSKKFLEKPNRVRATNRLYNQTSNDSD